MTFRNGADGTASLTATSINPATGLATDYFNRFNEAVMLLDMLSNCPEFRDDFLTWEPMSYRSTSAYRISRPAIWRSPPTTGPIQTSEILSIRWP
jgi:hypothetical protein